MHIKSTITVVMLFVLSVVSVGMQAQPLNYTQRPEFKRANQNWIFQTNQGMNHSTNPPTLITSSMQPNFNGANEAASVSDTATGNLLFYTNGSKCWNRNNLVMPNGLGLKAKAGSLQGACVVPVIGETGKYYIFTIESTRDLLGTNQLGGVYYSIVDMALDGGLGDIVSGKKNILLHSDSISTSMIAIPGNNSDVWLMVHKYISPVFMAYHITTAGIDTVPTLSVTNTVFTTDVAYALSAMAVSPDRTKIAICSRDINNSMCLTAGLLPNMGGAIIAQFDPCYGTVYDDILITDTIAASMPCFSPDNSKLYFGGAILDQQLNIRELILQYDVSSYNASAIQASSATIATDSTLPVAYYKWGMRSNGTKIYIATGFNQGSISTIHNPNNAGVACNYQNNDFQPLGPNTKGTLGNDAVYPLPPDTLFATVLDTLLCTDNNLDYTISAAPAFQSYIWNDGDTNMSKVINDPGTYWVFCKDACHSRMDTFIIKGVDVTFSLGADTVICDQRPLTLSVEDIDPATSVIWHDSRSSRSFTTNTTGIYWATSTYAHCRWTDSIQVRFIEKASIELGQDIVLCRGQAIAIDLAVARPQGASILWSTGSTNDHMTATDTGIYWVNLQLPPCNFYDSVHIGTELCECLFNVPSAFSPNGDSKNDVFYPVIESGCRVSKYVFSVYNRFGQRIFVSFSEKQGWDGTMNGVPAEIGTYFYDVKFVGGSKQHDYYKKGDVALIR